MSSKKFVNFDLILSVKVPIYNQEGEKKGEQDLPESIFNVKSSPDLIHQVVVAELANRRNTVAHTKTRGEVRGGGKKPWRQKGTGRARAGSIRSPLWRGGGVAFGPRADRNFHQKVNRKQFRKSLFAVLTDKLSSKNLYVLEDLKLESPKTKDLAKTMKALQEKLNLGKSVALVLPKADAKLERSARNLQKLFTLTVPQLSPYNLLKAQTTVILKEALPVIEKTYLK